MAFIFKHYRFRIAERMAADDKEIKTWLNTATFAKASTGHWLAWHADEPSQMAMLLPDHPKGEPCRWIASRDSETPPRPALSTSSQAGLIAQSRMI